MGPMRCPKCVHHEIIYHILQARPQVGLDISIKKVFDRIGPVLCNILEGGGGELVEAKRGATFKDVKVEQILTELRGDKILLEVNYMVGSKRKAIINDGIYVGPLY